MADDTKSWKSDHRYDNFYTMENQVLSIDEVCVPIMLMLSDTDLLSFASSTKQFQKIYNYNELWRLKFSRALEYNCPSSSEHDYFNMYKIIKRYISEYNVAYLVIVAVENEMDLLFRICLEKGASLDYMNFMFAIKLGKSKMLNIFLDKGMSVSTKQIFIHDNHEQAITVACRYGHLDIVKILIENGADIMKYRRIILTATVSGGNIDIMKLLMSKGLNIHEDNDEALKTACYEGKLDMVKFLLSKGADVYADFNEPLQIACQNGRLNVVKYILNEYGNLPLGWRFGTDVYANPYQDPLFAAYTYGDKDIVKLLVNHMGDVSSDHNYSQYCMIMNNIRETVVHTVGRDML